MSSFIKPKRILLAVAVLVVASLLMVACQSGDAAPDAIYFAKEHTPRQTYVQGQELDFTNVVLTCDAKGETTTVAMDAEGVTISGYDKNTLGTQTVTVTYREQTTTFSVTVIPRIAVEGFDANYFVGDVFNKQNGRIKYADDNANVTTINMKDDAVVISGFDSASAGKKTVTVTYNGYSGSFQVDILGVENVKLNSPSKKAYQSHETEFSVAGGYFTVISEGSVIQKTVPITQDMVAGFDPTVATIDNRTAATAAKQKIQISYLGFDFEMEISIRYSGVSIVKQHAENLKNVDISQPISEVNGSGAMEAINEYLDLSKADQGLIAADELDTVARVAAVYAYDLFVKETAKYSHTFTLSESESTDQQGNHLQYCGYFTISCERYEDMVASLEVLKDKNSEFNVLADFLHAMEEEFKNLEITEGVKIDAYFKSLFLKDDLAYVADLFKQLTAIYKDVMIVPEIWDKETIKDSAMVAGIESAYLRISTSNFYFLNYPEFYSMISAWRAQDDLYEIIHTHYLYNKTYSGEGKSYSTTVWEKIPFPGHISLLYNNIASGYSQSSYMTSNVADTTTFMLIYRDTLELVKKIMADENQLYQDIYDAIDFDDLIDGYLYSASKTGLYSYLDILGNLANNKDVLNLFWNDYFAIIDLADEDGTISFENPAVIEAIRKMFDDLYELTPYERYRIICTLYSNYGDLKIDGFAFDFSEGMTGTFITMISGCYTGENGILPTSTHELFQKLLIATEQYGIRYKRLTVASEAVDEYIKMMDEVIALFGGLSHEDQVTFLQYAGNAYNANVAIYNSLKKTAPSLEQYPLLEELKDVLDAFYKISDAISEESESANEKGLYALLLSSYEKANALRAQILSSNDPALIEAYRFYNYIILNENDENETNDYNMPLESVFDDIKAVSYGFTLTVTKDDGTKISYNAVEYYTEGGIAEFLGDCFKVLYTNFCGEANTQADVLALMAKFRALEEDPMGLFYSLNVDACYYAAMEAFFASALANDSATATLATALLDAEKAYAEYVLEGEQEEALAAFKTAWNAVETAKIALGTALDNYNALLADMYDYYLSAYNALEDPAV